MWRTVAGLNYLDLGVGAFLANVSLAVTLGEQSGPGIGTGKNANPAWAVLAPNFNGKVQVSTTAPFVIAYNSWVFSRHGCSPGRGKKRVPFVAAQTNGKCLGTGSQSIRARCSWTKSPSYLPMVKGTCFEYWRTVFFGLL